MRLIDADALMEEFAEFVAPSNRSDFEPIPTWNDAVSLLGSAPTIAPEPVKHAKWIRKDSKRCYWFECSECGYPPPLDRFRREWFSGYCPNCGSQIDEVEE